MTHRMTLTGLLEGKVVGMVGLGRRLAVKLERFDFVFSGLGVLWWRKTLTRRWGVGLQVGHRYWAVVVDRRSR